MAAPRFLHESETQVKKDLNKIQYAEIKFLRNIKGCSIFDKIKNKQIRKELEIKSITNKIICSRHRWK